MPDETQLDGKQVTVEGSVGEVRFPCGHTSRFLVPRPRPADAAWQEWIRRNHATCPWCPNPTRPARSISPSPAGESLP